MNRKAIPLFVAIGYPLLFAAGYLSLLFASNLRSRIYYHAPNYSFLFWLFLYSSITGFGLLRLRKWAVPALFLPGILVAVIEACGIFKETMPWPALFLNLALVPVLLGVPANMLRYWNELRW
jgi:hypothetical protein